MKRTSAYTMSLVLTAGALGLTAPAAMAAGQCEITSHRLSDNKVEVEVQNLDGNPQEATAWFRPNYSYAGPGIHRDGRCRTVGTSGVVEPNGRQTLVIEAGSNVSRLREPVTVFLTCTPTQDA